MYKIKIHFLFFCLIVLLICTGHTLAMLSTVIAAILHELAHALAARARGFKMERILLMPYGAVLYGGENFSPADNLYISAAGPILNVLLAIATIALWWIIPDTFIYTEVFARVNLTLAAFNLLPAFPLDGARFILGLCKNKRRALKGLRISGLSISFLLLLLCVLSAFWGRVNLSFGITAIFLAYGSMSGTRKEMYLHVSKNLPFTKNHKEPIVLKDVMVSEELPLYKLLEYVRPDSICVFHVTRNAKEIKRFEEKELEDLILKNEITRKIKETLDIS